MKQCPHVKAHPSKLKEFDSAKASDSWVHSSTSSRDATSEVLSSEFDQEPVSPLSKNVLLLSFLNFDEAAMRPAVSFKRTNSIESYQQEVEAFVTECRARGTKDMWIAHFVTVDAKNQAVIGGKVVTETELYAPLNCYADEQPRRIRIFQLTCQLEESLDETDSCHNGSTTTCRNLFQPYRSAYSGLEVYRFTVPSGANLLKVHDSLCQVFNEMETCSVPGKLIARRIESCNSGAKPQLVQVSGIPSASPSATAYPAIPTVPDFENSAQEASDNLHLHWLQSRWSTECERVPTDLCVGITVGQYDQRDKPTPCGTRNRDGCSNDLSHITEAAQCLGCNLEDIHVLCPRDGIVTKDAIAKHTQQVVQTYKGDSSVRHVYLFVSAHGGKNGFTTSIDETVQVREVVEPLLELGAFVLLFYQPCRGEMQHSTQWLHPSRDRLFQGTIFHTSDTSGCCLPQGLSNCAAIFASTVGYKSYRNKHDGSLMFKALRDVLAGVAGVAGVTGRCHTCSLSSVNQLAELVQQRLHELRPDGIVQSRRGCYCYVQVQFTVNSGADWAIQTPVRRDKEGCMHE